MVLNHFDEFKNYTETNGGRSQNYLHFYKRLGCKRMLCIGLLLRRNNCHGTANTMPQRSRKKPSFKSLFVSGWPCIYMLRIICKYAWISTSTSLSRHGIYRDITFTTPHRWFCYFLLNFIHDIILGSAKDVRWSELLPLFWSLCLLVALYGGETGEEQTYVSGCRR